MKNHLIPILILLSFNSFAQNHEFWGEFMNYPRVLINENFEAYTVTFQVKNKGVVIEEEMPEPRLDNPHFITIRSDDKAGILRIKNKNYEKDLVIYFSEIYKANEEDNSIMYHFVTTDPRYTVTYVQNFNFNDFIFITLNRNKENEISIDYTISEL